MIVSVGSKVVLNASEVDMSINGQGEMTLEQQVDSKLCFHPNF